MKEIRKRIREITLSAIIISVFAAGCEKKKDDKALLFGAAALSASRSVNTSTTASTYTIGGTVSDLWTSGLVLQNNAGDDVTVTATSGTFTFATKVSGAYAVTVKTQPSFATCTVGSGSGTATADVTNVSVSCLTTIGGGILRLLNLTSAVTVFAGPANGTTTAGTADGTASSAMFTTPMGITTDGTNLYVSDYGSHRIRKIVISTGAVSTLAGNGLGFADGTGTAALFQNPSGLTTDGTNLYVADRGNNKIRKIVISTGAVTTLAGNTSGSADGTGTAALFNFPQGIATDGTNLYVSDTFNHRIRKIVISTGVVTTLAGNTNSFADGTGTSALFSSPNGLTTEGTNLYVADTGNHRIRKIVISTGVVTTLAGNTSGTTDGTGTGALFNGPTGILTDGTNLYVIDSNNHRIRKIVISSAVVTTLAGNTGGDQDGSGTAALFQNPAYITSDGTSLYVTDSNNNKIRRIQ